MVSLNLDSSFVYLLLFFSTGICSRYSLRLQQWYRCIFFALNDVISMMDSMVLVLHFHRAVFTVKSVSWIMETIALLLQILYFLRIFTHNKKFLLQKCTMCLLAKHSSKALGWWLFGTTIIICILTYPLIKSPPHSHHPYYQLTQIYIRLQGRKTSPARWVFFMSSALDNYEKSIHSDY